MALAINDGFSVGAGVPIEERLYLTKQQMININENIMPDVYFCICPDDGNLYTFSQANVPTPETGKFRKFEGGTSSDFTDNFNIVEIKDDPSDINKVTGYKIYTKSINDITGATELNNEIMTQKNVETDLLDFSTFDKTVSIYGDEYRVGTARVGTARVAPARATPGVIYGEEYRVDTAKMGTARVAPNID